MSGVGRRRPGPQAGESELVGHHHDRDDDQERVERPIVGEVVHRRSPLARTRVADVPDDTRGAHPRAAGDTGASTGAVSPPSPLRPRCSRTGAEPAPPAPVAIRPSRAGRRRGRTRTEPAPRWRRRRRRGRAPRCPIGGAASADQGRPGCATAASLLRTMPATPPRRTTNPPADVTPWPGPDGPWPTAPTPSRWRRRRCSSPARAASGARTPGAPERTARHRSPPVAPPGLGAVGGRDPGPMAATARGRPALPTRKIPARPPPVQSPATRSSPGAVTATADSAAERAAGCGRGRGDRTPVRQPGPGREIVGLASTPPLASGAGAASASRCVPPEAARASGTAARATGRIPPVHDGSGVGRLGQG